MSAMKKTWFLVLGFMMSAPLRAGADAVPTDAPPKVDESTSDADKAALQPLLLKRTNGLPRLKSGRCEERSPPAEDTSSAKSPQAAAPVPQQLLFSRLRLSSYARPGFSAPAVPSTVHRNRAQRDERKTAV